MTAMPKFGLGTANPVDTALEILDFGIVSTKPHINPDGMHGTRSQNAARTIEGVEDCRGSLRFAPNISEAVTLLEWALGMSTNTGVSSLNEALTSRFLTYDRDTKVDTYQGAYVDTFELRAAVGQAWDWTLGVICEKELSPGNSGTFPSINITHDNPLALHHATMTLFGTAREFADLTLRVNNRLDVQTFNSDYPTSIVPGDTREVMLSCLVPYNSTNADLRRCAVAGDDGVLAFTYGTRSMSFALGNVQFPRGGIEQTVKGRKFIRLNGTVRMTGSDRELVVTTDNTP